MTRRSLAPGLLALVAAWALSPAPASAEFSAATLLSRTQRQFDEADNPAFSRDGRYVAFRGSLDGVPGVYRRELSSGEVVPVAIADAADPAIGAPDAAAPSISADGRYVAFTSAADLDPAAEPAADAGCPQVYRRDMSVSWQQAQQSPERAFTLVSAVNGASEALTYSPGCPAGSANTLAMAGAQAAPGVALSADGSRVAFTVLSASNLTGACTAAATPTCPTEPAQVAVRDLTTQTTTLVSATPAGEPTPGGGTFPSAQSRQRLGGGETPVDSAEPTASSAAISGDGTTVAWQGTNVPAQVPGASDVTAGMAKFDGAGFEVEPLWRRFLDGPGAATKRLLGAAGLNFYFEGSHENVNSQPIEGGAIAPADRVFAAPALSADGSTVAVLSNGPTGVNEASYQFLSYKAPPPADLYEVRVGDGPSAPPRVTPLTATPDYALGNAAFDGVADVAISADGSRVAFNTRRVSFALPRPTLVSPPVPEVAYDYTYEANLALGALQRVTSTYEGSPPNGEPGRLSLSGDGLALAFASSAANLFYGDATPGVSQVYLARDAEPPEQLAAQSASAPPPVALPAPSWVLSATASPLRDGSVVVYARAPGAGRLSVSAGAQLPSSAPRASRQAGGRRSRAMSSGLRARLLTRTVARATALAAGPSDLRLRLRVGGAYRALAASRGGLYALLSLGFAAAGHATLTQRIPVTFRVAPPGRRARARTGRRAPSRGKAGAGAVK